MLRMSATLLNKYRMVWYGSVLSISKINAVLSADSHN